MLKAIDPSVKKTYVGYTNNISLRLKKHNSNRGAKSTKGYKWLLIYNKKFITKSEAMAYEYKLKKDRNKRSNILNKFNFKNNTNEIIKN
jgi:putative endonuclease